MYVALSLAAMIGLLVCLILIYTRLEIGLIEVPQRKRTMVHTTFSVYLGWITVAPIANVAALLVDLGWDAYNTTAIYITVAMILIALVLTVLNTYIRGDVAYAAVLVCSLRRCTRLGSRWNNTETDEHFPHPMGSRVQHRSDNSCLGVEENRTPRLVSPVED